MEIVRQYLPQEQCIIDTYPFSFWESLLSALPILFFLIIHAGFEKMDHGLSENFTDRVSPIEGHVNHLKDLGVASGPLNPHVNSVTSDVVKVRMR